MSFRVEPGFLDGYALQVSRAADDGIGVRKFLDGYPAAPGLFDGGANALIWAVGQKYEKAMPSAIGAVDRVATVLASSGTGLIDAARHYRATDASAAARLDGTLLGRCLSADSKLEQQWAANPCAPSFSDSRDPSNHLKPVDDVEFSHPLRWMDNLSVAHWALTAMEEIFGLNPLEWVLERIGGDWHAVARGGIALQQAADAMQDIGYNVQGGAIALRGGWAGTASDLAYEHFSALAQGAADLAGPCREISKQFGEIAHAVWQTQEAVSGWVKGLIDHAIVVGLAAVAGTATSWTGIGAAVGYGVAALEVANMLRIWAQITSTINNIYALVQGALGIIEGQLSRLEGAAIPNLSNYTPYRHPSAA